MYTYAHVCACMWKPEVYARHLLTFLLFHVGAGHPDSVLVSALKSHRT